MADTSTTHDLLRNDGLIPTNLKTVLEKRGKRWAKTQCLPEEASTTQQRLKMAYREQCRGSGLGMEGWVSGEWHPIIYCPDTRPGGEMIFRTKKRTADLYKHLLAAVNGVVHEGVLVCEITDPTHPVLFAAPLGQSCYTLVYTGPSIAEHSPRVVFGEYTGTINNNSHTINRFEYVFDLTFCKDAWRFTDDVFDDVSDEEENNQRDTGKNESSKKKKLGDRFSSLKDSPKIVLPGPRHFVLDSHDAYNEMSLLNHYGIFSPLGSYCSKKNCEWQQVFVDGWPHVVLTSIPGVEIKTGEELFADFGNEWFYKVQAEAMKSMCRELLEWRLGIRLPTNSALQQLAPNRPIEYIDKDKDPLVKQRDLQICGICRDVDRDQDDASVHCDTCDRPFHLRCLDDADKILDEYKWFCMYCVNQAEEICAYKNQIKAGHSTSLVHSSQSLQAVGRKLNDMSEVTCSCKHAVECVGSDHTAMEKRECGRGGENIPENIRTNSLSTCNPESDLSRDSSSVLNPSDSSQLSVLSNTSTDFTAFPHQDVQAINTLCSSTKNENKVSIKPSFAKPVSLLCPSRMGALKNGLKTNEPLPPVGFLADLKPCKNCYDKLGESASAEVCRLVKRHLEGNWDHPDNATQEQVSNAILLSYRAKLIELQMLLLTKKSNSSNDVTHHLKDKRKTTTSDSRKSVATKDYFVNESDPSGTIQTKGFVPLIGVHLGKTTIRTEFADGWWTGTVVSYHPISYHVDMGNLWMPTLLRVMYSDGDSEWIQPERLLEVILEQAMFSPSGDAKCVKPHKMSSLYSLLNPEFLKLRRIVNAKIRAQNELTSKKPEISSSDESAGTEGQVPPKDKATESAKKRKKSE